MGVQCTFINPVTSLHCVMCQTAQPAPAPAPASTFTPAPRPTSSAQPARPPVAAPHASHASDDDDDDDDDEGWDDGEGDDGDESFQRPDNSAYAVSDEKATALHAQFSEVCQLLKTDEAESGKQRKRKSSSSAQADERRVKELITTVYTTYVLPAAASSAAQPKRGGRKKKVQCEVCFENANIVTDLTSEHKADEDSSYALTLPGCQHNEVCSTCMTGHIESKVMSADVAAWVSCPHPSCTTPLHSSVLCYPGLLTTDMQLRLLLGYLTKLLSRSTAFVRCSTSQCPYGFLQLVKKGKETKTCPTCAVEQAVERGSEGELDESFKKMIASGTLRACPTCQHYTLKEKGQRHTYVHPATQQRAVERACLTRCCHCCVRPLVSLRHLQCHRVRQVRRVVELAHTRDGQERLGPEAARPSDGHSVGGGRAALPDGAGAIRSCSVQSASRAQRNELRSKLQAWRTLSCEGCERGRRPRPW